MPFFFRITGPRVIALMFLFAVCITAGLWIYWDLHTRPYRPLTVQLAQHFPGSRPRVEGGKHGLHKETLRVLRVVMQVDFHPEQQAEKFQQRVNETLQLVAAHHPLNEYDQCEIHLFQQIPEQAPVLRSARVPSSEFP